MGREVFLILLAALTAATSAVFTDALVQSTPVAPTFDVVSVKRNVSNQIGSTLSQRPDGGLTITNVPVSTIISRAYPVAAQDMVGLPDWARTERYDINATSSLPVATAEQRIAMLRALLTERFNLTVHVESRELSVYDLVLARRDGRLGSGLTPVDTDCARIAAERAAASTPLPSAQRPDLTAPPPPCTVPIVTAFLRDRQGDKQGAAGNLLEGETTMSDLANGLRVAVDRSIVDKTGLAGSYHVRMNFALNMGGRGGPALNGLADAPPSVITAVQEQLGLKLESSRAPSDTIVIDRLERPTLD